MNGAFNGQILEEKLSKLNSSQQSIETLSHWCIFHRKNAKQVVETWDKQFNCAPREQRVSFLFLANDIIQNSRRKGAEFVNEFWRVLPEALKDVFNKGDDNGKKVALRLVDIWEERKVFGSRGQYLKEELIARNSHVPFESNSKNGQNSHSTKRKSVVGDALEQIISAYETVNDRSTVEESALVKCKAVADHIENCEKKLLSTISTDNAGTLQESTMLEELKEKKNIIEQCVNQLEVAELARTSLISVLTEALNEQEAKVEKIRSELKAANHSAEQADSICHQLTDNSIKTHILPSQVSPNANMYHKLPINNFQENTSRANEGQAASPIKLQSNSAYLESASHIDEEHKKAAAAVAAKLTASSSSAQMLSYVLSSLASEAAAMTSGLKTSSAPLGLSAEFHVEKRPKLEQNSATEDINTSKSQPSLQSQNNSPRLSQVQNQMSSNYQQQSVSIQQAPPPSFPRSANTQSQPSSSMQHQSSPSTMKHPGSSPLNNGEASPLSHQLSPMQPQPQPQPQPPPPPPPPQPQPQQYIQGTGNMTTNPYVYGGNGPQRLPFQGFPIMGVAPQGMPHFSMTPQPYHMFPPSDMSFQSQPPLPTTPISRQ